MASMLGRGWPAVAFVGRGMRWLWGRNKPAVVGVVLVIAAVKVAKVLRKRRLRRQWDSAGQDVVVLHTFARSSVCPNLSPYALKLETYLRMASIKHVVDYEEPLGPKGKCPWITINGEDIADSQLIMERLDGRFQRDLGSSLTPDRKAVAKAFQVMTDEHLVWYLAYFRYVVNGGRVLRETMDIPLIWKVMLPMFRIRVKKVLRFQGVGLHTKAEVEAIAKSDLRALSDYLGHAPFLMGEEPTQVDCAVFGTLAQIEWCDVDSPLHGMLQGEFGNLKEYCHRMKQRFWPDWNRLCHL